MLSTFFRKWQISRGIQFHEFGKVLMNTQTAPFTFTLSCEVFELSLKTSQRSLMWIPQPDISPRSALSDPKSYFHIKWKSLCNELLQTGPFTELWHSLKQIFWKFHHLPDIPRIRTSLLSNTAPSAWDDNTHLAAYFSMNKLLFVFWQTGTSRGLPVTPGLCCYTPDSFHISSH